MKHTTTNKHPLKVWAYLHDITLGQVATDLGVSQTLISLWMSGRRRIGSTMAQRIGEMTDGVVMLEDWPWLWLEAEGVEIKKPGAGR
jgi:transcriptional regulator with XRE-family HTH domain